MKRISEGDYIQIGLQTARECLGHARGARSADTTKAWNALQALDSGMRVLESYYSFYVSGPALPGFTWQGFYPEAAELDRAVAALNTMIERLNAA